MAWVPRPTGRKAQKAPADTSKAPADVSKLPTTQSAIFHEKVPGDSLKQRPEGEQCEGEHAPRRRRREPRIDPMEEAFMRMTIEETDDIGRLGQTISVLTNFFELETLPKFIVHEYLVTFNPECVRRRNRLSILNKLKESLLGPFAYDGMKLFVVSRLGTEDDVNCKCEFRGQEFEITIKHVNEVAPNTLPFIQLLGVLFRDKLYRLNMRSINRNLYELGKEHRVQEDGIYVFPGVKASILPRGENRKLLICVDKMHKIINSSTLDEYMYTFERWDQNDKDEVKRFLVGQSVVTRYNMNSYRIGWQFRVLCEQVFGIF